MEKLVFWDKGGMVETIGSMDEIEGMMDCETAYRILRGVCYDRKKYKWLSKVITEMIDEETLSVREAPLNVARKLDNTGMHLPVPEDIFLFIEKAYMDGYEYLNDKRCAFLLGNLYSNERYGHIDYPKAAKWFSVGAEAGDGEAEAMLGKCQLLGLGVPRNYEKAFQALVKWALISYDKAEALYLLGDMYYEGLYVKEDKVQAYELYQEAWNAEETDYSRVGVQALLRIADYRLNQIGDKEHCKFALNNYLRAETGLYDYLLSHPAEARAGIMKAQEGQRKAREALEAKILSEE